MVTYNAATNVTTFADHKVYEAFSKVFSETSATVDTIFGYTGRFFDDLQHGSTKRKRYGVTRLSGNNCVSVRKCPDTPKRSASRLARARYFSWVPCPISSASTFSKAVRSCCWSGSFIARFAAGNKQ